MKKLAALAFAALIPFDAQSYRSEVPEWDSVEIQTVIDGARVIVSATASSERLTSLVVTMRGNRVIVPPAEFSDLLRPRLTTLRVVSPDSKSSPGPDVRVELSVQADPELKGLPPGTARFHFGQLKYLAREVSYQRLVHETKVPGQAPQRTISKDLTEVTP